VTSPFDALAPLYAAQWSESREGRSQREQVWREIDAVFQPGDRVLDVGCGIGDDAVHLRKRGIEVIAIDSSARMIEIARARGVPARHLSLEDTEWGRLAAFDGVLSNFGALNCLPDLPAAARIIAPLIRPHGALAICTLSRFSARETLRFLLRGDLRRATRRWSGHTVWRGLDIYYRGRRQTQRAFAPYFTLLRRIPIGSGDHQLYLFQRSGT
jgi:SAM-dependent methyltransferase